MTTDSLAITDEQHSSETDLDPRLLQLSRDYLAALRGGQNPSREDYLARIPDLQEEASEYLEGIEMAFSLEQAKNASAPVDSKKDELQGKVPIGDFRIIREIGRGGMGVVYEAIQISLGRSVALKVLPFAAALDDRHRKRFLLEAQAAAQLHHNHIVPVYAVGCERGTHYYAMQLIDGRPISSDLFNDGDTLTGSCTTKVATRSSPKSATTPFRMSGPTASGRSALNPFQKIAMLIADAAEGLEYAHSCGIVHRDVKPANLLLDVRGKIWIADFGLAQITTGEHVTQTGDMLGTMRYMSPEQASGSRGVVDHRSDVYSLGATLYELLARRPVFDGSDRQTLLHQVLHDDPKPLRLFDRAIPEELEIITLKALRHSAADRYESAQHFADDLRRYLSEIPIVARRPTMIDQVRKWTRRHPTTVLSLLFAMVVTLISLAATTAVVTHQKSLTQNSLSREQRRATQAERRLATAQAAADEMIRMAENEFTRTPMEEILRLRLLSSALTYYQALLDDSELDPEVRAALTQTRDSVARSHDELQVLREDRSLALLADTAVHADLGLNEAQIAQIQESGLFVDSGFSLNRLATARARKEHSESVLTPAQLQRLKQIAVQVQGPSAVLEVMFSGDLDLSDAQASSIQSTFLEYLIANGSAAPSDMPTSEGQQTRPFRPDAWLDATMKKELMELVLEKLTPQQRETWSILVGPVYDQAPEHSTIN
jgi:eukaryotic-like serine/threonine-protein kinase